LLAAFLGLQYGPRLVQAQEARARIRQGVICDQDFALEAAQLQWVREKTAPGRALLYDNDVVLAIFLSHGALDRRAVFTPALPLPPRFSLPPAAVRALVGWNPYLRVTQELGVRRVRYPLQLPPGAALELELEPTYRPTAMQVLGHNGHCGPGAPRLAVTRRAQGQILHQEVELSPGAWRSSPLGDALSGGTLELSNPATAALVYLGGLRLAPDSQPAHFWPWQGVSRVTYRAPRLAKPRTLPLLTEFLLDGRRYGLEVRHDGGASVLWEMKLLPAPENVGRK
jgi:hypothetical protein